MDIYTLATVFVWLTLAFAIVAGLSGLLRFWRVGGSRRWLALLAGFDATIELTAKLLSAVAHLKSNLFLFPIVLTGEIVLLALLYRQELQSARFAKVAPWAVGLFGLYALLDQLASHTAVNYAPGVQVVSCLLMLGMVWLYFRKLLNDLQVAHLGHEPIFLFSVSLTVYALGSLLIALFSNYILTYYSSTTQFIVLRIIRNLFNVELYVCYTVVLWMRPPRLNLSSS